MYRRYDNACMLAVCLWAIFMIYLLTSGEEGIVMDFVESFGILVGLR